MYDGRVVDKAYGMLTEVPERLKVSSPGSIAGYKLRLRASTNQDETRVAECDLLRALATSRGVGRRWEDG
jgi:hypothetical protein